MSSEENTPSIEFPIISGNLSIRYDPDTELITISVDFEDGLSITDERGIAVFFYDIGIPPETLQECAVLLRRVEKGQDND